MLPRLVSALDAVAELAVLRNRHRRLRSGGSARQRRRAEPHVPHPDAAGPSSSRLDVLLLLALQRFGMRTIEAVVLVLVATIGVCYFIEIFVIPQTQPSFLEMGRALVTPSFRQVGMVYVAIGMIGATVMPHNLYLHSALVQSRDLQKDDASIRRAIRFNTIDSTTALTVAFLVNAAILVLAAMVFYGKTSVTAAGGQVVTFSPDSDWIRIAYLTLAPLLGTSIASTLFVIALLASGQSSTITGTLAGQVVMEGFMHWRIQPWLRRMITRTARHHPGRRGYWSPGRQQRERSPDAQSGRAGAPVAVRHVSVAPLHLLTQAHGRLEERLVSYRHGLGQRALDYGVGCLRAARFAENGLACHRRSMTPDSPPRGGRV